MFPDERDKNISEFKTNNILDSIQIQVFKMFGHTHEAYAFGSGVAKFPQWMKQQHPGCWKGLKRLVGNRANIFLENAVVTYFMASYYLEYCDYVLRRVHGGNALHMWVMCVYMYHACVFCFVHVCVIRYITTCIRRLDAKLRSKEMPIVW